MHFQVILALLVIYTLQSVHLRLQDDFVEEYPKLTLKSYRLFATNRSVFQNETHLILPRVFDELVFECTSTLPTKWFFYKPQRGDDIIRSLEINKWRHHTKFVNGTKFWFTSIFKIQFSNPHDMINITCENACPASVKGCQNLNTFLVWYGDTDDDSVAFFDLQFHKGNKATRTTLLKWCPPATASQLVSKQNIEFGENKQGDVALGRNQGCDYALHVDLEAGTYACTYSYSTKEVASLYFDCSNPDECDAVYNNGNDVDKHCKNITTYNRNCTLKFCSELRKTTLPFVIACGEANSNSVARSFFKTLAGVLEGDKRIYDFESKNIIYDKMDLVQISMTKTIGPSCGCLYGNSTSSKLIYTHYNRDFVCQALKSFFTYGFHWKLRYQNGSEKLLGIGKESTNDSAHLYISRINILFDDTTIVAVVCEAPNWNSIHNTSSSHHVTVMDSIPPYAHNTDLEEPIEMNLISTNEPQKLICNRTGVPPSIIRWTFDGIVPNAENLKTHFYKINDKDEKSEVELKPNHPYREILCAVRNAAGEARFLFKFDPEDKNNNIIFIAVCTCAVILLLAVILLAWYMNKKHLEHECLTTEEINGFFDGTIDGGHEAFSQPYNTKLEVSMDSINMYDKLVLGSGAYGQVLRGSIGLLPVAIKVIKPGKQDVVYVKSLLAEIKIMSFVGTHANIVNLIGCSTAGIEKNNLHVLLEFCERGDLLSLLRKETDKFINIVEPNHQACQIAPDIVSRHLMLSTTHLVRWAIEIAAGMEFISAKKIIHGDLAARNILITNDLRAKVSDFGLSKHLYEYTVYIKKGRVALPARWMAYESLKQLEFSPQSDVWSFGVVLWEMFSLGKMPYEGINWGFNSWSVFEKGTRLAKPKYASDEIYEIMKRTWNIVSHERPDFSTVKAFLEDILKNLGSAEA